MELLDVYDSEGNVTGKVIERGSDYSVLNKDEHIALVVIFMENDKGEFLIQKASVEKGGKFASTGGHVSSGETPLDTIRREVLEELGINIYGEYLEQCGFLLFDMPIRYLFYLKKNIDLNDIVLQKEEVESVKYMSIDEINDLISKDEMLESHGKLFKEILKMRR